MIMKLKKGQGITGGCIAIEEEEEDTGTTTPN
jgi:hypothetical protein